MSSLIRIILYLLKISAVSDSSCRDWTEGVTARVDLCLSLACRDVSERSGEAGGRESAGEAAFVSEDSWWRFLRSRSLTRVPADIKPRAMFQRCSLQPRTPWKSKCKGPWKYRDEEICLSSIQEVDLMPISDKTASRMKATWSAWNVWTWEMKETRSSRPAQNICGSDGLPERLCRLNMKKWCFILLA